MCGKMCLDNKFFLLYHPQPLPSSKISSLCQTQLLVIKSPMAGVFSQEGFLMIIYHTDIWNELGNSILQILRHIQYWDSKFLTYWKPLYN